MTPKEKAEELYDKIDSIVLTPYYLEYGYEEQIPHHAIKECALIAVDELIENVKSVDSRPPNYQTINEGTKEYWKQVKNEIYEL